MGAGFFQEERRTIMSALRVDFCNLPLKFSVVRRNNLCLFWESYKADNFLSEIRNISMLQQVKYTLNPVL